MEMLLCDVTEWYQLGKDTIEFTSTPYIIKLPKYWEGEATMPMSDVKIHAKGSCSARYQSVHFGVELVVKDVPFDEAEEYQVTLQELCFERLDDMEPQAQQMLSSLVAGV